MSEFTDNYQQPAPYFGGKREIAHRVWNGIGRVGNYVEPFCGMASVLMMRPGDDFGIETVNDADGFIANFWRAVKHDPASVAVHADNPVSEPDLHARHMWLVGQRERITDRLCGDPDWYDEKIAGWWVWGACCWIGSGWCTGEGPWRSVDGVMTKMDDGSGVVKAKLPHLGAGQGVNRQLPHLGAGQGVNRQLPHLGAGHGVNRQLPHLGDAGQGECARRTENLIAYMRKIADRLRNVRVCCGDWQRVCGPTPTFKHGMTGVFLDPPYADTANRYPRCYAIDSLDVAHRVREWAIEAGKNPLMRIVLAGYEGEHEMPADWRVELWKAKGGYSNQGEADDTQGKLNAHKERLWFSPACEPEHASHGTLFDTRESA